MGYMYCNLYGVFRLRRLLKICGHLGRAVKFGDHGVLVYPDYASLWGSLASSRVRMILIAILTCLSLLFVLMTSLKRPEMMGQIQRRVRR
jgi:hypothetical protein